MYFPIGLPLEYRFPKVSAVPEEPIGICSNRDRSLILLLTSDTLHIWFCKPCVQITALQRSAHSIAERGKNVQAVWKSDATTLLVTTDKGRLLFFKLEVDGSENPSLYLRKGFTRKQHKSYDAVFLGEGIPALTLRELHSFNLQEQITSVSVLRDELLVATRQGSLKRIKWDCTVNEAHSTCLTEIQFSYDLQQSRGRHLKNTNEHIVDVEYSPLLGGFVAVLSGGRGFFLAAPNTRFDIQNLHGVWAPDLRDATCVHANHKYRLIVFGCQSGKGIAYHIDPATGALQISHELTVSTKQYPDAGIVGGAICKLAWTPDECAIIAAWKKGGLAVWSVFGALLFCSLKASYGLPSPSSQNTLIVKAMEWGAEGYQLWISTENTHTINSEECPSQPHTPPGTESEQADNSNQSHNGDGGGDFPSYDQSHSPSSSPELDPSAHSRNFHRQLSRIRGKYDFLQIHFVKSPLTVNPCLSNHKHLFLQSEDKLYVNLGSDRADSQEDASNILIANKQWRVIPIKTTYLGSNWPIRYSAMDDSGLSIAIAGRTGLAHYSLLRRRWILFGNEAQEKNMVVCGGLIWWRNFICVGCFDLLTGKDQIRFYPSTQKLDNGFCITTTVPFSILLINTFQDYLICLCADRHIMIFAIQVKDIQTTPSCLIRYQPHIEVSHNCVPQLELRRIQEVSVNGFIPHPMCVTFLTLSTLNAETSQGKDSMVNTHDIPESILMNVAGHLLMFQRDWSGPQPKQSSNKYRPVPFCNPMKVASSVENIWVPDIDSGERKELVDSLWLSSGATGMKVWLTLSTQDTVQTHSFMSKRIMLPFDMDIYPLAVLAEDAVILGAASDHSSNDIISTTPGSMSNVTQSLDFSTLERTSEIYLHQVLRQLLRRNLGYHALQLARCFTSLPYFSHILELLLHEVLEEEATSKEPIPDPLLPRVVLFSKEFPQYRKTVAHCARKTEIALWEHLFSTVGSPKALFEECLVNGDLDTASSYLIILQNLEKFYVSRQHATLLLESALETRSWPLARDVVRFLKRIDPHEADIEPVSRPLPSRYGQRFATQPLELEDELNKAPLVRNPSLSFYEADSRIKEKSVKSEGGQPLSRKHSVTSQKTEEPEKHDVEVLLYRHARKLLAAYRIRDLGLFAANLEEYELVAFLRKERHRGARIEDPVQAIKQLHDDFQWPLPILTHSAFYRTLRKYSYMPATQPKTSTRREDINDGDLGDSQSTKDIILSPIAFELGGETSTPDPSEDTDLSDVGSNNTEPVYNHHLSSATSGDLSRSNSESQLHDISMELANRGPKHSETELRYLYQVMVEAECFDWCLLFSLVLRDQPLFSRTISLAAGLAEKDTSYICKLSSDISTLKHWIAGDCLGYKPFLSKMAQEIDDLNSLCKRLVPDSRSRHNSRLSSISSDSTSEQDDGPLASSPTSDKSAENPETSNSESCVIS